MLSESDLSFSDMVRLDINYIEHWSLWLDIVILLKNPPRRPYRQRGNKKRAVPHRP